MLKKKVCFDRKILLKVDIFVKPLPCTVLSTFYFNDVNHKT